MIKKIISFVTISFICFSLTKSNVYALGEKDNVNGDCTQTSEVYSSTIEHQKGNFEIAYETDEKTLPDLEKKDYKPEVVYDFCQENPDAESCQPAPTNTERINSYHLSEDEKKDPNSEYQCEDEDGNPLPDVSCDEKQKEKIKDKLADGEFYCVNSVTVKYKDMEFTITDSAFPGYKIYAKKSSDTVVAFYLWNESAEDPIYMHYEIEMQDAWGGYAIDEVVSYSGINFNKVGAVDIAIDEEPNSLLFDIFITNIDNPSSKYYGKYYLVYELTDDGSLGASSPKGQDIWLTSKKEDGLGTNVAKIVPYQNDRWKRSFALASQWKCFWISDDGSKYAWATPSSGHHFNLWAYNLSYYYINDRVTTVVRENNESITYFPSGIPFASLWEDEILNFETGKAWKDVYLLKQQNDNTIVYGDTRRGEIVADMTTGIWTWKQHRQQNELTDYLVLALETSWEKYRVCIGEYHCDCEDINVLCSCDDEEVGCNPEIACPAGQDDCSSAPADGESGTPGPNDYGIGATKPVLNDLGLSVPSGGPGGATGKGSQDYYEKYLEGSSTLLN